MHAIETVDLARRFGRQDAVDALNLHVPTGSVFAFIGPNGAGKTTTIKVLMNLVQPTTGRSYVLGTDSRQLGRRDFARIGYVSENQRLPDWMSVSQLLSYLRPLYPTWDEGLSHKLQVDLDLTSHAPLRALSRGTRMKVALLAALAYHPKLLVLDEPFTGLDPAVRDDLTRTLSELRDSHQSTVFISSHDLAEVEMLADTLGFIDHGRLMLTEPVSSLLARFRRIEVTPPERRTKNLRRRTTNGCGTKIIRARESDATSLFDRRSPLLRSFYLRNRRTNEAIAGIASEEGQGSFLLRALPFSFGVSQSQASGFWVRSTLIRFQSSYASSEHSLSMDEEWIDGAELAIVRAVRAGAIDRQVVIRDIPLPFKTAR